MTKARDIPTAKQARAHVDAARHEALEREAATLFQIIVDAMNKRTTSVEVRVLSKEMKEALRAKGYSIRGPYQSGPNETAIEVSW